MLKDVRAKPLKSLICGVLRGMDIPHKTPKKEEHTNEHQTRTEI